MLGSNGYFWQQCNKMKMNGNVDITAYLSSGDEAGIVIALLNGTFAPKLFMILLLVISFIFLATIMDSCAFATVEITVAKGRRYACT